MLYVIIGRRGTGKTTIAYRLALGKGLRTIYDPRGEFHTTPAHEFLILEDADREELIVTPEIDAALEFQPFCEVLKVWIREVTPGAPRSVLIDECRFVKHQLRECAAFDWLIRCSDRNAVNVILTAHRPSDIPVDVRAIADKWIVFQTTQEHDLKVLEERCGGVFAEKVQTLNDHQFLSWDDARGVLTEYRDPRTWFVPLRSAGPPPPTDGRKKNVSDDSRPLES